MIQNITHLSGLEQEAIILFPDEEFCDYVVFQDVDNPYYSIIEIDKRGGFSKKISFEYLKTLSDDEIFEIFFPKNKKK
jgi:hypothetical protein